MTRSYTLKKRAEQQAETRQRIVEAAVELHSSIGPAATTISLLAERAGVQRHTVYAHFPDDRSLFLACSGLALERDAPPSATAWREIADRRERLRSGFGALYAWYGRNAEMAGCVLRDAESHALTREIVAVRLGPFFDSYGEALGEGLNPTQRAMLGLALSFHSWRTLTRDGGLDDDAAARAMAAAVIRG